MRGLYQDGLPLVEAPAQHMALGVHSLCLPGAAFLHINAGQENQLEALNATWWGQLSLRALSSVLRQEGEKTSHQDLSHELRLRVALPRVGVDPID